MQDLKFAIRQLAKSPGFTVVAVLTLAICVGANLAIFAVVDAILLHSLPFKEPGRLVTLFNTYPRANLERAGTSMANYFDRRQAIKAFESVSVFQETTGIVGENGSPRRVPMMCVSAEFFVTLGVPFQLGQPFTDAELNREADDVAIITDGFWRSQFSADPNVLGRTFMSDGRAVRVIGVLPQNFRFLSSHAQFFRPASHPPQWRWPQDRHDNLNWTMIARLAPGTGLEEAQAQMDVLNTQLLATDPIAKLIKDAGFRTIVRSLREDHVRAVKPTLVLLQCGVCFLLLTGGVNLANLFLIRAHGRTREFTVRQALGASRRQVASAVVVETTLLALGGGIVGLLIGSIGIDFLGVLGVEQLPLGATIRFDGRLAAVSLVLSVIVGLFLALPVVWFHLHAKLGAGLQAESHGGTSTRTAQRLRHGFIVAQIALAFTLLSGAGLLGASLKRVLETPPGFRTDNLLTGRLVLPGNSYQDAAARQAFVERLLPALRSLPGVTHAAINTCLPFTGRTSPTAVTNDGQPATPGKSLVAEQEYGVAGDYWQAMGIVLHEGRLLEDADGRNRVCVVDQAFAQRHWPGTSALNRRFSNGEKFKAADCFTVVGVVGNVKQNELVGGEARGTAYLPYAQYNDDTFFVVVRTALPPAIIGPALQQAVAQLDPQLPIDDLKPMQVRIDDSLVVRRSPTILAAIFAGVSLLLCALGTYGVLAYAVAQRRREIGVRMALGAMPGQVGGQFLKLGFRLLAVGTVLGVFGAWLAGHAMQGVLFAVPPLHLATLVGTSFLMGAISLLACWLPARRATKVNPVEALRAE